MNNPKINCRTHYRIEMICNVPNKAQWQRTSFIVYESSVKYAKNRALQLAKDAGYSNIQIINSEG